jgi:transcription initiation factor IIE alpha subunit
MISAKGALPFATSRAALQSLHHCTGIELVNTSQIFEHIKKHGQVRDAEIAAALGLGLTKVRNSLSDLFAKGQISCCNVTRFKDGEPIEEILCRLSGYVPPPAPGRKPKR